MFAQQAELDSQLSIKSELELRWSQLLPYLDIDALEPDP